LDALNLQGSPDIALLTEKQVETLPADVRWDSVIVRE